MRSPKMKVFTQSKLVNQTKFNFNFNEIKIDGSISNHSAEKRLAILQKMKSLVRIMRYELNGCNGVHFLIYIFCEIIQLLTDHMYQQ